MVYVSLLQTILRTKENYFGFPQRLCFNEIDSVLRFVDLALLGVKLKFHVVDNNESTRDQTK